MFLFHINNDEYIPIKEKMSLGRVRGDVTFSDDDIVSTTHANLYIKNGKVYYQDIGSTNGSFINKKEIPAKEMIQLEEMDHIQFGEQEFYLVKNKNRSFEEMEEEYKVKRKEALLGNVIKKKAERVAEIDAEIEKLKAELETFEGPLRDLKAQYEKKVNIFKQGKAKLDDANAKVAAKEANLQAEINSIEKEKQKIYKDQTNLIDQLKLQKLANAPAEEIAPMQEELDRLNKAVKQWDAKKASLPGNLEKMKTEVSTFKGKVQLVKDEANHLKKTYTTKMDVASPDIQRLKKAIAKQQEKRAEAEADLKGD